MDENIYIYEKLNYVINSNVLSTKNYCIHFTSNSFAFKTCLNTYTKVKNDLFHAWHLNVWQNMVCYSHLQKYKNHY